MTFDEMCTMYGKMMVQFEVLQNAINGVKKQINDEMLREQEAAKTGLAKKEEAKKEQV